MFLTALLWHQTFIKKVVAVLSWLLIKLCGAVESCSRHSPCCSLSLLNSVPLYLYFLSTRTFAISKPKLVAFVALWVSFLSWVQAGQTWETISLVTNRHVLSIGMGASGKILAGIQQPVAIFPWFYGQKDEGTKLFYFSTKASYRWGYAHCYNNNSSVVKASEVHKKSF